jgi:hypothetical protein
LENYTLSYESVAAMCPGAVPVLVCLDEVVVEYGAEQAADVKAWLEKAMIEGIETVLNCTDQVDASVGVEARPAPDSEFRRWRTALPGCSDPSKVRVARGTTITCQPGFILR